MKLSRNSLVVLIVIIVLLAAAVGFVIGRINRQGVTNVRNPINLLTPSNGVALFQSQTAIIQGKILHIDGNTLMIQSTDGPTAQFTTSKYLNISKFPSHNGVASTSSQVKDIELDRPAMITLTVQDKEYKVSSIAYLPPAPTYSKHQ